MEQSKSIIRPSLTVRRSSSLLVSDFPLLPSVVQDEKSKQEETQDKEWRTMMVLIREKDTK
jgi:hypothetical protein